MPRLGSTGTRRVPSQPEGRVVSVRPIGPTGAEGRALRSLGGDIAQAGEVMFQAQRRIQNRADVIANSRAVGNFIESQNQELLALRAQEDFGAEGTTEIFGQGMQKAIQQALSEHKGSANSKAQLAVQLETQRTKFALKAAGLAKTAQDLQIQALSNARLGEIILNVTAAASQQSFQDGIEEWTDYVNSQRGALTAPQEELMIKAGYSAIAQSSMDVLMKANDFVAVEDLLNTPFVVEALGPKGITAVRGNMIAIRTAAREKALQAVGEVHAFRTKWRLIHNGVNPTEQQTANYFYPTAKGGDSAYGKSLRGISLDNVTRLGPAFEAGLLSDFDRSVFINSATELNKATQSTDPTTGLVTTVEGVVPDETRRQLAAQGVVLPAAREAQLQPPRPLKERLAETETDLATKDTDKDLGDDFVIKVPTQTAWSLAEDIAGPIPSLGELAGKIPGLGDITRGGGDFTEARSFIGLYQKELVRVLQNNPRYVEGERIAITEDIKMEGAIFDTKGAYRRRLIGINRALEIRERNAFETAQSKDVGRLERTHARNVFNGIRQFRANIGVPPTILTNEEYDALGAKGGGTYLDANGTERYWVPDEELQ